MGLDNLAVTISHCRTVAEADRALAMLAAQGLRRGGRGLRVYLQADLPANLILADEFARRFDGLFVDARTLQCLVLGMEADATPLRELDEAVTWLLRRVVSGAHAAGRVVGIGGLAVRDRRDLIARLVTAGVDLLAVEPDQVLAVQRQVAVVERDQAGHQAELSGDAHSLAEEFAGSVI
jgi:pyruvate,water dikinase